MTVAAVVPDAEAHRIAPTVSPPAKPLLGYRGILALLQNPVSSWAAELFERDLVVYEMFGRQWVFVMEPNLVGEVLATRHGDFPKSDLDARILNRLLGEGILIAQGARWKWQRRAVAPLFRPTSLKALVPHFASQARELAERWGSNPGVYNVDKDLTSLTFSIIQETMLGGEAGLEPGRAEHHLGTFFDHVAWDIAYHSMGLPRWLPHPGSRAMRRTSKALREHLHNVVSDRRAQGAAGQDLLDRLIAAEDPETGKRLSDENVVDNLLTFLIAGHETTASTLTWVLFLLAKYPEWQQRLAAEVERVVGSGPISGEHVDGLNLTRQVINEAMRVYAPAPIIARLSSRQQRIGDHQIKANAMIFIPIYVIHRHRELWDKPDVFWPERFAPERSKDAHRYAYMPFGGGHRVCIGNSFSMLEATAIVAELVRSIRLALYENRDPEPIARITMRPRGGLKLRVSSREHSM